jgi:hypothetical protein
MFREVVIISNMLNRKQKDIVKNGLSVEDDGILMKYIQNNN